MTVLFDTNVILDALLRRDMHEATARQLINYVEKKKIKGALGATTITTIDYIVGRASNAQEAHRNIGLLLDIFGVAPIDMSVLQLALQSNFSDFEDAMLYYAALQFDADAIVTRDAKGFSTATLPVYAPSELLSTIESG